MYEIIFHVCILSWLYIVFFLIFQVRWPFQIVKQIG